MLIQGGPPLYQRQPSFLKLCIEKDKFLTTSKNDFNIASDEAPLFCMYTLLDAVTNTTWLYTVLHSQYDYFYSYEASQHQAVSSKVGPPWKNPSGCSTLY